MGGEDEREVEGRREGWERKMKERWRRGERDGRGR